MLHHNTEGGLFSGYEDAGHRSEEEDTADLYSVLSTLEDFRGDDGKLHFKLCYPEVKWAETADRCNEWRQQSNPYTSTVIRGFKAVGKLAFPHQSECRPWKVGSETLLQCRYYYYYLIISRVSGWTSRASWRSLLSTTRPVWGLRSATRPSGPCASGSTSHT